jgi:hypothetical protein
MSDAEASLDVRPERLLNTRCRGPEHGGGDGREMVATRGNGGCECEGRAVG